jgi:hypothetical protein
VSWPGILARRALRARVGSKPDQGLAPIVLEDSGGVTVRSFGDRVPRRLKRRRLPGPSRRTQREKLLPGGRLDRRRRTVQDALIPGRSAINKTLLDGPDTADPKNISVDREIDDRRVLADRDSHRFAEREHYVAELISRSGNQNRQSIKRCHSRTRVNLLEKSQPARPS